jgi:lactoylglutathione lyase
MIGMAATFNHVGCCVTDLQKARRFYEGALGLRYERELKPPDGVSSKLLSVDAPLGLTAVYLSHGDFTLELLHYDRPGNPPARARRLNEPGLTHVSITVDDVDNVLQAVEELGGRVRTETHIGVAVLVEDPDGQVIELLAGNR